MRIYKETKIFKKTIAIIAIFLLMTQYMVVISNADYQKLDLQFEEIAVGDFHTLALDKDGKLYTWGKNNCGQLGRNGTNDSGNPTKIMADKTFIKISASTRNSFAIDNEYNLWGFGKNDCYQMGDGTKNDITSGPKIISSKKFKEIVAGINMTYAIGTDGYLYYWGTHSWNGTNTEISTPTKFSSVKFNQVSGDESHGLAISQDGHLYSWGSYDYGRLGNSARTNLLVPTMILTDKTFLMCSAGDRYSVAIDSNHKLWEFGNIYAGYDGNYARDRERTYAPEMAATLNGLNIVDVVTDGIGAFALDSDGNVWYNGFDNSSGQAGDGTRYDGKSGDWYKSILVSTEKRFKKIYIFHQRSLGIDTDGNTWVWGYNTRIFIWKWL